MAKQSKRGFSESSWLAARRCLALVSRLQQGPAGKQELRRFRRLSGQLPTADLRLRDSEEIAPDVWEKVLEGWQAKQELHIVP